MHVYLLLDGLRDHLRADDGALLPVEARLGLLKEDHLQPAPLAGGAQSETRCRPLEPRGAKLNGRYVLDADGEQLVVGVVHRLEVVRGDVAAVVVRAQREDAGEDDARRLGEAALGCRLADEK